MVMVIVIVELVIVELGMVLNDGVLDRDSNNDSDNLSRNESIPLVHHHLNMMNHYQYHYHYHYHCCYR